MTLAENKLRFGQSKRRAEGDGEAASQQTDAKRMMRRSPTTLPEITLTAPGLRG